MAAAAAMGAAARRLHRAEAQPPRLKKLALHPPKSAEVEFHLPTEFLRVYSPPADSKIRSIAGEKGYCGKFRAICFFGCVHLRVQRPEEIPLPLSKEKFAFNPVLLIFQQKLEQCPFRRLASFVGQVIFGRRHVGIMSAESVGNYGVRILFDDLHKTGIFTWDYLHHLGSNKYSLMRNYIRTLRKHGLTRDPQRRK